MFKYHGSENKKKSYIGTILSIFCMSYILFEFGSKFSKVNSNNIVDSHILMYDLAYKPDENN